MMKQIQDKEGEKDGWREEEVETISGPIVQLNIKQFVSIKLCEVVIKVWLYNVCTHTHSHLALHTCIIHASSARSLNRVN